MPGPRPAFIVLEVGASKICAAVLGPGGDLLGFAVSFLPGFPERAISFPELVAALTETVAEAKAMAQGGGKKVWIVLSPGVTRIWPIRGLAKVSGPEGTVTRADLLRAMAAEEEGETPGLLHRLWVGSILDGREVFEDPVGMTGDRLEVRLLRVEVEEEYLLGLRQALLAAGLEPAGWSAGFMGLVSVLSPAEREIGTAVLDLGATHTTAVVYFRGRLRAVIQIGMGGLHLTKDLAVVFGLSRRKAEEWKKTVFGERSTAEATVRQAREVLWARLGEILTLVRQGLAEQGWWGKLPGGFVLTGGGASAEEVLAAAREFLSGPVRRGFPAIGENLSITVGPAYAAVLGVAEAVGSQADGMAKSGKGGLRWRLWFPQRRMPT